MATAVTTSAVPSSAQVAAHPVSEFITEQEELRREVLIARLRMRAMFRAMNDQAGRTLAVVGVFGRGDTVERIVRAAQTAEALGQVPALRFLRDVRGEINGVEMAILERPQTAAEEEFDAGFRVLAQMAVTGGDDA